MKIYQKVIIGVYCLLFLSCYSHGNTEFLIEASVFGDVSTPGKQISIRENHDLITMLKKSGLVFDEKINNSDGSDNFTRIFVASGNFQVAYDLPDDRNLISKIILPQSCSIFVCRGSVKFKSINEVAIKSILLKIEEGRGRLSKLLSIGSIDSVEAFQGLCLLKKQINILHKNDFDLNFNRLYDFPIESIQSEIFEVKKSGNGLKFRQILEIERERNGLGPRHPQMELINKMIVLLE